MADKWWLRTGLSSRNSLRYPPLALWLEGSANEGSDTGLVECCRHAVLLEPVTAHAPLGLPLSDGPSEVGCTASHLSDAVSPSFPT